MNARVVLPLAFLGGCFYLLVMFQSVLLPFLLAATAAYVLNPFILYFEMRGVRRERAVMVIYTVLLFFGVSLAYIAISAAIQSASTAAIEMPLYLRQAHDFLLRLAHFPMLQRFGVTDWVRNQVVQDARTWVLMSLETAPTWIRVHLLPMMEMAFLVPFLTYFFMLDGKNFIDWMVDLVPARYVEMFLNIIVEIDHSFGNYLRGLLLQALFMGILAGIGYGIIGLHFAVYIAIWVAMSSMIPFLGPISAALAGALIALFQWGTLAGLIKVLVIYIVIRTLDDWLLHPMILRRAVQIHPVVTVFSLMAGAYLSGIWGLLFAVPVACMIKVLFEVTLQWYRIEYGFHTRAIPPEAQQIPVV